MLLILTHLTIGPMLLHAPRPGVERQHRLVWLALTGIPGAAGFWGRLLVLEALAETSGAVLVMGLATAAAITAAAVRALVASDPPPSGRPAALPVRMLAWLVCLAVLVLGFAPATIAEHVFGVSFA
jgi:NADH:ubiquinone oxidoreductase subunit 2 (subunit N)